MRRSGVSLAGCLGRVALEIISESLRLERYPSLRTVEHSNQLLCDAAIRPCDCSASRKDPSKANCRGYGKERPCGKSFHRLEPERRPQNYCWRLLTTGK